MMQNPQLGVAAQRAAVAWVNPGLIQSQLVTVGAMHQAAAASGGGVAAAPSSASGRVVLLVP